MASMSDSNQALDASFQRLHHRWQAIKEIWSDPVQRDWEQEYWDPLQAQTKATHEAMKHLAEVIAKARRSVK